MADIMENKEITDKSRTPTTDRETPDINISTYTSQNEIPADSKNVSPDTENSKSKNISIENNENVFRPTKLEGIAQQNSTSSLIENSKAIIKIHEECIETISREDTTTEVQCQTEWSWLEDMKLSQRLRHVSSRTGHSIINTPGARSSSISLSGISGRRTPSKAPSIIGVSASIGSGASGKSKRESAFSGDNFTPAPLRMDEYGIPILCISSDDEESEEGDKKNTNRSGKFSARSLCGVAPLPSIGPPPIIQYQPESKHVEIDVPDAEEQKKLLELQTKAISGGLECNFCEGFIKSFPSLDDQKEFPPDVLFCCDDYKRHLYAVLTHPDAVNAHSDNKIDVQPHPPYGSKHARKVAKERAAQRLRDREMARQQASFATNHPTGGTNAGVSSFFQFARQMKTINYMLSSQRCMDEGWTIRPPSPLVEFLSKAELFEPEPVLPLWVDGSEASRRKRLLVRKFYPDRSLFVAQFPDGTGTIFYPNGSPAITISSIEMGVYTYIVQSEHGNVASVFYTGGTAMSDFSNGSSRLNINKVGGIELTEGGARKRIWRWYTKEHVHAPPIQPIIFSVGEKRFGVRIAAQDNIALTFSCNKRACRFQVGSKLKPYSMDELEPVKIVDENLIYRREVQMRVREILCKVSDLLRFPNTSKFCCPGNTITITGSGVVNSSTTGYTGTAVTTLDSHNDDDSTRTLQPERRPSRRIKKVPEVIVT